MKIIQLGFLAAAVFASGCSSAKVPTGQCAGYLRSLAVERAVVRAERVVRSGEPYFLGVKGFALSFPGVEDPQVVSQIGYKIMEGTSDVIKDSSCWRYQRQAHLFAEQFNRRIIQLVSAKGR